MRLQLAAWNGMAPGAEGKERKERQKGNRDPWEVRDGGEHPRWLGRGGKHVSAQTWSLSLIGLKFFQL